MTTDKLNLLEIDLSVPGWDVDFNFDIQTIDDAISTIEINEYGETIAAYEAVFVKADGKYWLAQANGTLQPAFGIAIDSGVSTDEKRARTSGLMTNGAWSWATIGGYIYLDPSTPGALTQTAPASNIQRMGVALTATSMFVNIEAVQSESISHVEATSDSGQTIEASLETVIYEDELEDDLGEYDHTTGVFTADADGKYLIIAYVGYAGASWTSGQNVQIAIVKGVSTIVKTKLDRIARTGTYEYTIEMIHSIKLAASETLKVQTTHDQGSSLPLYSGASTRTVLSIDRLV